MAEIQAFHAWRYNQFLAENLFELTAPLSETKLQQKRANLYQKPFHNFHIASPTDVPPYENVDRRVSTWKLDGVIEQDPMPAIYVYFQKFRLKAHLEKVFWRKGFIAMIKTENYQDKIIFPHEKTLPKAVEYRKKLLKNTLMNTNPTHGLYTDSSQEIEPYLEEAIQSPINKVIDNNGVEHFLGAIHNYQIIKKIQKVILDKKVIIADGHHRYESSLWYSNTRQNDLSNYHLMYLTNTESSALGIFPTHRIIHSLSDFSRQDFLDKLSDYFEINEENPKESQDMGIAPTENLWVFKLIFSDKHYLIRLKPAVFSQFEGDIPQVVKELDVSVLHYFILEKALGLSPEKQLEHLEYSQFLKSCLEDVGNNKADFAILTRKVTYEEIQKVCFSGYTMPAKATYFYPKVLGGLLFSSINPEDLETRRFKLY